MPRLIQALGDEFLYVRICAAGALGSIGPAAAPACEMLVRALSDPTVRSEAQWALHRITGVRPDVTATDATRPESGASVRHTPASQTPPLSSATKDPPLDWDVNNGRNIAWSVELGDDTFGRPVPAPGIVIIGTSNSRR